jgi:hypothetical protein
MYIDYVEHQTARSLARPTSPNNSSSLVERKQWSHPTIQHAMNLGFVSVGIQVGPVQNLIAGNNCREVAETLVCTAVGLIQRGKCIYTLPVIIKAQNRLDDGYEQ